LSHTYKGLTKGDSLRSMYHQAGPTGTRILVFGEEISSPNLFDICVNEVFEIQVATRLWLAIWHYIDLNLTFYLTVAKISSPSTKPFVRYYNST
jgi:hypothetical protein